MQQIYSMYVVVNSTFAKKTSQFMFVACNEILWMEFENGNVTKFWDENMIDCVTMSNLYNK
jgi:hypothetical protein